MHLPGSRQPRQLDSVVHFASLFVQTVSKLKDKALPPFHCLANQIKAHKFIDDTHRWGLGWKRVSQYNGRGGEGEHFFY